MKTIARIPGIFRKNVGETVFSDLLKIYPQGDKSPHHHVFGCFLPLDDLRTVQVMERLALAGFHPWTEIFRNRDESCEYSFELERQYDEVDLAECRYLQLLPPQEAYVDYGPRRTEDGRLIVAEKYLPEKYFDVYGEMGFIYFVPASVKEILEASGLVGLRLRGTEFRHRDINASETNAWVAMKFGLPFWELDSDRIMSPVSPSMILLSNQGDRLPPGSAGPCLVKDGMHLFPELRYRESDLSRMEQVDVARTYEFHAIADRRLIVSKRFYDVFSQRGLKTGWVPVLIDAD